MTAPVPTSALDARETVLRAAETSGWPALRARGVRVRGGEVAWRQLVTLAEPATLAALAGALDTRRGARR